MKQPKPTKKSRRRTPRVAGATPVTHPSWAELAGLVPREDWSEADVVARLVRPLILLLGYSANQIHEHARTERQLGRNVGRMPEADVLVANERGGQPAYFCVEAKKPTEALSDNAVGQARSYALAFGAPYAILTNGHELRLFVTPRHSQTSLTERFAWNTLTSNAPRLTDMLSESRIKERFHLDPTEHANTAESLWHCVEQSVGRVPAGLAVRALVPVSNHEDPDDWSLRVHADHHGKLFYIGGPVESYSTEKIVTCLSEGPVLVVGPSGRGRSTAVRQLARGLAIGRIAPLLQIDAEHISASGLTGALAERLHGYISNDRQSLQRLIGQMQCIVAIDGWERLPREMHSDVAREAESLVEQGGRLLVVSTPSVKAQAIQFKSSLHLCPLTLGDAQIYVRAFRNSGIAESVARLLIPMSLEPRNLSEIAEFCARHEPERYADSNIIASILDSIARDRIARHVDSKEVLLFLAFLCSFAVAGGSASHLEMHQQCRLIGLDSEHVSAIVDAGLLRETPHGYEFSESIWHAYWLFRGLSDANAQLAVFATAAGDVLVSYAALYPWARLDEPRRTTILRGLLGRDLRAYFRAVTALDSDNEKMFDKFEGNAIRYGQGVEDLASRMNSQGLSLCSPWNVAAATSVSRWVAVVLHQPWFALCPRGEDDPVVRRARSEDELAKMVPPGSKVRIAALSRRSGALNLIQELDNAWKQLWLPMYGLPELGPERVLQFVRLIAPHKKFTSIAALRRYAAAHNNDVFLETGEIAIGGAGDASLIRRSRVRGTQASMSGTEALYALDSLDRAHKSIEALGYPGPDLAGPGRYAEMYSLAKRVQRLEVVCLAALRTYRHLVQEVYSFLRPHSPYANGTALLRVSVRENSGAVAWWEPTVEREALVAVEVESPSEPATLEAIQRRIRDAGAACGYSVPGGVMYGNLIAWEPASSPASELALRLLRASLKTALSGEDVLFGV